MGGPLCRQNFSHLSPMRHPVEVHRSQGGLVGKMVEKDDKHHENMSAKSVGAVTSYGRRVGHHSQHLSHPEFDAHNPGHGGRTDASSFPLRRKTDSDTLGNRNTNGKNLSVNLKSRILRLFRKGICHTPQIYDTLTNLFLLTPSPDDLWRYT